MSNTKDVNFHSLGGKAIVKKYGKKYFSQLAKQRWAKVKNAE